MNCTHTVHVYIENKAYNVRVLRQQRTILKVNNKNFSAI